MKKLRDYINLRMYALTESKPLQRTEIMEILSVDESELATLEKLIQTTANFLKIVSHPEFESVRLPQMEKVPPSPEVKPSIDASGELFNYLVDRSKTKKST